MKPSRFCASFTAHGTGAKKTGQSNRLIKNAGEAIEINYLLKTAKGRWRVVDVFLDAKYSELAMKRSEYRSVIKNAGFDELIRSLDQKIADLAAEE